LLKRNSQKIIGCFFCWFCISFLSCHAAGAGVDVQYRFNLADFSGTVKSFQAKVAVSRMTNEVFVFDPRDKDIRIFNDNGIEIFRLGEENEFAWALDFTVDDKSNIYVLFPDLQDKGIAKYNFRGDPLDRIELQGIPSQFANLKPGKIVFRRDRLYLIELSTMRIVVIDMQGNYQAGYFPLPDVQEAAETGPGRKLKEVLLDMFGFDVDDHGNMYFTVPVIASVFRYSPDGQLERFGKAGSSPGQFGVVAGIAVDEQGNMYLADKLRCVVMVYDKDFNFINEFGFRGYRPSNLIVPSDVAVANGNIFVSQAANRGVSVFRVRATPDEEVPAGE
jgi:DNA-binding beta-propeller fold protein YncE